MAGAASSEGSTRARRFQARRSKASVDAPFQGDRSFVANPESEPLGRPLLQIVQPAEYLYVLRLQGSSTANERYHVIKMQVGGRPTADPCHDSSAAPLVSFPDEFPNILGNVATIPSGPQGWRCDGQSSDDCQERRELDLVAALPH